MKGMRSIVLVDIILVGLIDNNGSIDRVKSQINGLIFLNETHELQCDHKTWNYCDNLLCVFRTFCH